MNRRTFLGMLAATASFLGLSKLVRATPAPTDIYPVFPLIWGEGVFGRFLARKRELRHSEYITEVAEDAYDLGKEDLNWESINSPLLQPRLAKLPSGKIVRLVPYYASLGCANTRPLIKAFYEHQGDRSLCEEWYWQPKEDGTWVEWMIAWPRPDWSNAVEVARLKETHP
jgi:hypothetical protein